MRLKKIRLAGFKSFVDPTNIPFPGDMTAIVGPNGCGKSNVIDAVRWVLGESSAKNLRGDAMTDVIFNGSTSRKPVSQCSVELVFDNSSNRIQGEFAAYSEISVKRVVTKEAISSYFLNASKCRRKDITDLFLGTGLGPRSYAIIEQGMISKLIESKPQELRVFIEEAAGISKYKERRKETQTRIKHTKENLDRLNDVCQELGEQIAKLKRQAAAATRYKELKQQERQLKAELATIKWLAQSKIMASSRFAIAQQQQLLDNLVAHQQGDESGLQALKNDQSITKQSIDDVQQQMFSLGSEITKIEQSQLFAQKREVQIQAEVAQIMQSDTGLRTTLEGIANEISRTEKSQLALVPDKALVDEQLYELENKKHDVDARLQQLIRQSKDREDAYFGRSQLLQQKQSQIQQTLSLQVRTETRLHELQDELNILRDSTDSEYLDKLSAERESCSHLLREQATRFATINQLSQQAKAELDAALNRYEHHKNSVMTLNARVTALVALQDSAKHPNEKPPTKTQTEIVHLLSSLDRKPLWEYFEVQSGYEKMLSSALNDIETGWVIDTSLNAQSTELWPPEMWELRQDSYLFQQSFTARKVPNTLAGVVSNPLVPTFFNHYFIAANHQQALGLVDGLSGNDRVITREGHIYTLDSVITPRQGDDKILRAAQIKLLNGELEQAQQVSLLAKRSLQEKEAGYEALQKEREACKQALNDTQQTQQSTEIAYQNLCYIRQQNEQRIAKLTADISQQTERLAQEAMSLEILQDEVKEMNEEVMQLAEQKREAAQATESLRTLQQQWQAQHTQLQSRVHEQQLLAQQIRNSLQILQEQKRNKTQLLQSNQEKLELLKLEAEDLSMPQLQQQEKLHTMLLQQQALREIQIKKQQVLAKIESDMLDVEKGQHGLNAKMDAIKTELESQRIRVESANVRAQSFIEQIADLEQSVKEIIATLPENNDEKTWQTALDNVSASIQRLGAVNLAAVAEYEEQFDRKTHLDTQHLDLTQALDTLENAMRKIDKETRSRFKQTFDQVNTDLKSLFPKVFGGGMAYLELTDDDMLDTGVTIMARPPGKKNSTIHLLSGGEKALTALSLVFAIFRLNPAPFCLLDEVDAPLDDANVGRFCRLVSEMSASVQFIYITHNKVAMEMATHLTGVTMAEPGVSRMVAVDMEQALAIAE